MLLNNNRIITESGEECKTGAVQQAFPLAFYSFILQVARYKHGPKD
jgi:hypothetical protein